MKVIETVLGSEKITKQNRKPRGKYGKTKNQKDIRNNVNDNDYVKPNNINNNTNNNTSIISEKILTTTKVTSLNIKIGEIFKSGYNSGSIYTVPKNRITQKRLLKAKPSKFGGRIQHELVKPTANSLGKRISTIRYAKENYVSGYILLNGDPNQATQFNKGLILAYKKLYDATTSNVYSDVPLLNMTIVSASSLVAGAQRYITNNGLTLRMFTFMILMEQYRWTMSEAVKSVKHIHRFRRHIPALKRKFPFLNEKLDYIEKELSRSKWTTTLWQFIKLINSNYFDMPNYIKFSEVYDLMSTKTDGSNSPVLHINATLKSISQNLSVSTSNIEIKDVNDSDIMYDEQVSFLKDWENYSTGVFSIDKALNAIFLDYEDGGTTHIDSMIADASDTMIYYNDNLEKQAYPMISYLSTFTQTGVPASWKQNSLRLLVDSRDGVEQFNRKEYFFQIDTLPRVAEIEDEIKGVSFKQTQDSVIATVDDTEAQNKIVDEIFSKLTPIDHNDGLMINDITEGFKYNEVWVMEMTSDNIEYLPGLYIPKDIRFNLMDGSSGKSIVIDASDSAWSIASYYSEINEYVQTYTLNIKNTDGVTSTYSEVKLFSGNIVMWERVVMAEYTDLVFSDGTTAVPFLFYQSTQEVRQVESNFKNKFSNRKGR